MIVGAAIQVSPESKRHTKHRRNTVNKVFALEYHQKIQNTMGVMEILGSVADGWCWRWYLHHSTITTTRYIISYRIGRQYM
jgi:hypothetical protein